MRYSMLISIAMLYYIHLQGQKYWDGDGGDSQWFTAANWTNNTIPNSTDNVILDNSIVKSTYIVNLPAANSFNSSLRITVKSLTISPATSNIITCVIPSSNKLSPALSTPAGSGYGLVINNNGVFLNSSGAGTSTSPVNSLDIKDSIKINNGGKYMHNTLTRHLNIVPLLSKASGTENGTFEFDVPIGTADLSLLNITYGNLVLSGTAANFNRVYTTPGSGGNAIINGNLIINTGVRLDVNFISPGIGTIIVKGNLQNEGTVNLANSTGIVTLKVVGNMTQLSNGQFVKFGPGAASIELNGISKQNIMLSGSISGNISFIMNNSAGAILLAPLSLPYMLILQNGQITTSSNLLTLQDMCGLQVTDSMSSNSFINGPLRKKGLTNGTRFLFPVGKNNMHRWLELRNAYGSYTVEYIRSNPHDLCIISQSGIDHISGVEYWKITADASPAPSAVVKLSFDNVNSGGITDLSALRVAHLKSGATSWANLSNSETAGTAGTRGYVTAFTTVTDFDNLNGDFFTLATSNPSHPLPLKDPIQQLRQEAQKKVLFTKLLHTTPSIVQGTTTLLTVLAEKEEPIRIALINKMGQPVRVQQFFLNKGNNKLMLDLSGLAAGIYQITGYTADRSTNTIRSIKL